MKNIFKLIVSLFACYLIGAVGSIVTVPSVATWYPGINKPFFNPPNWIFAPVWIILYVMMGISAYLVWKKGFGFKGVKSALLVFLLQLALNSVWSIVFFGLHSIRGGLIVIIVLLISILWTILRFISISKQAAVLLVPYIIWVSFATVLNTAIVLLNR
jgi:benzodiazapine receptor